MLVTPSEVEGYETTCHPERSRGVKVSHSSLISTGAKWNGEI